MGPNQSKKGLLKGSFSKKNNYVRKRGTTFSQGQPLKNNPELEHSPLSDRPNDILVVDSLRAKTQEVPSFSRYLQTTVSAESSNNDDDVLNPS